MYLVFDIFFIAALMRHCYTDIKNLLLYDWLTVCIAVMGLIRTFTIASLGIKNSVLGFFVMLFIMLLIYFCSGRGMGEGDIKLAAALGFWLGAEQGILCLLLAFIGGGIFGCLWFLCGTGKLHKAIPFGPFLCAGAFIAYFWGVQLINWYWRFMVL